MVSRADQDPQTDSSTTDIFHRHSAARIGEIVTAIGYKLGEGDTNPTHHVVSINSPIATAMQRIHGIEHEAHASGISDAELAAHDEAEVAKFIALLESVSDIAEAQQRQAEQDRRAEHLRAMLMRTASHDSPESAA